MMNLLYEKLAERHFGREAEEEGQVDVLRGNVVAQFLFALFNNC